MPDASRSIFKPSSFSRTNITSPVFRIKEKQMAQNLALTQDAMLVIVAINYHIAGGVL